MIILGEEAGDPVLTNKMLKVMFDLGEVIDIVDKTCGLRLWIPIHCRHYEVLST